MATVAEIRAGIAANLTAFFSTTETVDEEEVVTPPDFQISAYRILTPTPPTLHVLGLDDSEYDLTMRRGADSLNLLLEGFVHANTQDDSERLLDLWLDPTSVTSVKAAVESDCTLGGKVPDLRVTGHTRPVLANDPVLTDRIFAVQWRIEVLT